MTFFGISFYCKPDLRGDPSSLSDTALSSAMLTVPESITGDWLQVKVRTLQISPRLSLKYSFGWSSVQRQPTNWVSSAQQAQSSTPNRNTILDKLNVRVRLITVLKGLWEEGCYPFPLEVQFRHHLASMTQIHFSLGKAGDRCGRNEGSTQSRSCLW